MTLVQTTTSTQTQDEFLYLYKASSTNSEITCGCYFYNETGQTLKFNTPSGYTPEYSEIFENFLSLNIKDRNSNENCGINLTLAEAFTLRSWLDRLLQRFPEAQVEMSKVN